MEKLGDHTRGEYCLRVCLFTVFLFNLKIIQEDSDWIKVVKGTIKRSGFNLSLFFVIIFSICYCFLYFLPFALSHYYYPYYL